MERFFCNKSLPLSGSNEWRIEITRGSHNIFCNGWMKGNCEKAVFRVILSWDRVTGRLHGAINVQNMGAFPDKAA